MHGHPAREFDGLRGTVVNGCHEGLSPLLAEAARGHFLSSQVAVMGSSSTLRRGA
jgi:hypothetical protein